jgi:AcrR family transcriptional regulator
MAVPQLDVDPLWSGLEASAKRERLLRAAGEVFAREGLGAPMPAVAAAAGAGIGSVYRQFPSKTELLAALVADRLEGIAREVTDALAGPGDAWSTLVALLWRLIERQSDDDLLAEAMLMVAGRPEVEAARALTSAAFEAVLDGARREGRVRSEVNVIDVRLLFAAARAADQVEPGGWRRVLEIFLRAFEA